MPVGHPRVDNPEGYGYKHPRHYHLRRQRRITLCIAVVPRNNRCFDIILHIVVRVRAKGYYRSAFDITVLPVYGGYNIYLSRSLLDEDHLG